MAITNFITDNFLLHNKYAEELYHTYAAPQPIIDYHCHLPPKDIAANTVFENITRVWINGDHYKWRAMRTNGVDENFITGNASDKEKFDAWAKTVPATLRNPLYHWTHLELKRYFDIDQLLNAESAASIYAATSEKLKTNDYSVQGLLNKMNVEVVCTTEDPIDNLNFHQEFSNQNATFQMSTAFRPDNALFIGKKSYLNYLSELENVTDQNIDSYKSLCDALLLRMQYFHKNGCRLCDHGLNQMPFKLASDSKIEIIFQRRKSGSSLSFEEEEEFQTALLLFLCEQYHRLGWVQQFHLGAMRDNNTRMTGLVGANSGWDSIGGYSQAYKLSRFLDNLDRNDKLTKTILYNLNPADNAIFATMVGNFNDGSIRGKVQWGSGWWFLDQKDGMEQQLNTLSNMGLLSCFIGMLTDSRSFMSFPRHEYFRRILCNILGTEMQLGELPIDMDLVGNMIKDICYTNAKNYFEF